MFWLTSSIVHLPKTEVLLDLLLWITKQLLGHHQLSLPYMRTFISLEYLHCYVPTYLCLKWVLCAKIELGEIRCSWHILMLSTWLIRAFLCLLGWLDFFQHLNLWSQPTVHCAKKFCFQWCHGCHVSLKLRVLTRLICVYPIISFHRVPNKHFFTFLWNRPTTCCFMLESFIRNGLCL